MTDNFAKFIIKGFENEMPLSIWKKLIVNNTIACNNINYFSDNMFIS
jgi:hypothetical protein